jgi:hypothetical protein
VNTEWIIATLEAEIARLQLARTLTAQSTKSETPRMANVPDGPNGCACGQARFPSVEERHRIKIHGSSVEQPASMPINALLPDKRQKATALAMAS